MSGLNLYQRRNAAKKMVYEHEFSKVMGEGLKFKYLPVEQIKPVVEKAWNDVGVVMDLGDIETENVREPWDVESQYGSKTRWYHLQGTVEFILVNMDDPSDCKVFTVKGEAKDNSDKVINKIYPSALKNFYKIEFNISEGPKDDTDAIQSESDLEVKKVESSRPARAALYADPFFSKPNKGDVPKFKTADKVAPVTDEIPTEEELASIINVKGAMPKFKEVVKSFKIKHGAKSAYDLSFDDKVELYHLIISMEGSA